MQSQAISGATEVVIIAGHPVVQVKSPANFNRWFQAHGQDMAMVAVDVSPQSVADLVKLARGWHNLRGIVVTVPHKQAFAQMVDSLSPRAQALGAVNVVRRDADGKLSGDMVDGFGFISAAKAHGFDSAGRRAAVVGAGGVGSAIAYALCESGIGSVALADSDAARLDALSRTLRAHFPKVDVTHGVSNLTQLDVLVNATPVGMNDSGALPLPGAVLETLAPHTLVADVVTSPELTPFLALAQARGCRIQKGPEMSLAQLELLGAHIGVMPTV